MANDNVIAQRCKESEKSEKSEKSIGYEGEKKHLVAERDTFEFKMGKDLCDPKLEQKIMEMFALGQRLTVGVENGHNHY